MSTVVGGGNSADDQNYTIIMTTLLGNQAESLAARYLEKAGLVIIDRNWRNRWCEIDIIARSKDKTIHFVEVKYRRMANHGSGLDYITHQKAGRMQRAALIWMQEYGQDVPFQIDVISIDGDLKNPEISYVPNAVID